MIAPQEVKQALIEQKFYNSRRLIVMKGQQMAVVSRMLRQEIQFSRNILNGTSSDKKRAAARKRIETMQDVLFSITTSKPYRKDA